ncbi:MAG: nucleotidyltransferase domain-containing protein [Deltaproteobacteria bacterium]|nr:MAG: nucleotidyltransferase domain-containing protein [Deltaproteobacteria bacterium]
MRQDQRSEALKLSEKLRGRLSSILEEEVEVILFGSQARGEATEESDIDVVVTVSKLNKKTLDLILEVAWEVGFEAGKVISVIPATFEEMERLSASPFFQAVKKEGIRV